MFPFALCPGFCYTCRKSNYSKEASYVRHFGRQYDSNCILSLFPVYWNQFYFPSIPQRKAASKTADRKRLRFSALDLAARSALLFLRLYKDCTPFGIAAHPANLFCVLSFISPAPSTFRESPADYHQPVQTLVVLYGFPSVYDILVLSAPYPYYSA